MKNHKGKILQNNISIIHYKLQYLQQIIILFELNNYLILIIPINHYNNLKNIKQYYYEKHKFLINLLT